MEKSFSTLIYRLPISVIVSALFLPSHLIYPVEISCSMMSARVACVPIPFASFMTSLRCLSSMYLAIFSIAVTRDADVSRFCGFDFFSCVVSSLTSSVFPLLISSDICSCASFLSYSSDQPRAMFVEPLDLNVLPFISAKRTVFLSTLGGIN